MLIRLTPKTPTCSALIGKRAALRGGIHLARSPCVPYFHPPLYVTKHVRTLHAGRSPNHCAPMYVAIRFSECIFGATQRLRINPPQLFIEPWAAKHPPRF